jgi:putative endonuclease
MNVFPTGWIRRWLGDEGERLAARHLRRGGMKILMRQARSQIGEIDLVGLDGDTIVFIEVKSRRMCFEGSPAEAVDGRKQRQLTRTALAWLKRRGLLEHRTRFDVVAVDWQGAARPVITHYRDAFEASEFRQMY